MGLLDNKQQVFEKLAEGKTRQEIFTEFSEQSPDQGGRIAYAIASIPSINSRKKYYLHNILLFSLLIGYSLLALTAALPLKGGMDSFVLVLKTCIPLFFSYYVYHFHGGLYRFLGLWCVIELFEVLFKEETHNIFSYSKGAVLGLVLLLTIIICLKVFPHFGVLNPKQDKDGKYQLG